MQSRFLQGRFLDVAGESRLSPLRSVVAALVIGASLLTLSGAVRISAGDEHSCAFEQDGWAWCWGKNGDGELGIGGGGDQQAPVRLDTLPGVAWISAGFSHTCATDQAGTAWCWGKGDRGQLGNNLLVDQVLPDQVLNLTGAQTISAGGPDQGTHSCAVTGDGRAWCWGENQFGQVGDGTFIQRNTPVEVPVP